MSASPDMPRFLPGSPARRWLVTGAAGFIGSHLAEALLREGQDVVALDNLATGDRANIEDVRQRVGPAAAERLHFLERDIRDSDGCAEACRGVDVVLHHAALGSVSRSIANPQLTHAVNVDGFVNMLVAARDAGVARFIFASSSSVYGDDAALPKVEHRTGRPLSPYAVSKVADELYASVFHRTYGMPVIGLRYFNVFGPRQDPEGAYAAVIPRWFDALLSGGDVLIHGDGGTSRDFCYVKNVVDANLLAAGRADARAFGRVFNVAVGETTSLSALFEKMKTLAEPCFAGAAALTPRFGPSRAGDILHSLADISAAREFLGYAPRYRVDDGLRETVQWYAERRAYPPLPVRPEPAAHAGEKR